MRMLIRSPHSSNGSYFYDSYLGTRLRFFIECIPSLWKMFTHILRPRTVFLMSVSLWKALTALFLLVISNGQSQFAPPPPPPKKKKHSLHSLSRACVKYFIVIFYIKCFVFISSIGNGGFGAFPDFGVKNLVHSLARTHNIPSVGRFHFCCMSAILGHFIAIMSAYFNYDFGVKNLIHSLARTHNMSFVGRLHFLLYERRL